MTNAHGQWQMRMVNDKRAWSMTFAQRDRCGWVPLGNGQWQMRLVNDKSDWSMTNVIQSMTNVTQSMTNVIRSMTNVTGQWQMWFGQWQMWRVNDKCDWSMTNVTGQWHMCMHICHWLVSLTGFKLSWHSGLVAIWPMGQFWRLLLFGNGTTSINSLVKTTRY